MMKMNRGSGGVVKVSRNGLKCLKCIYYSGSRHLNLDGMNLKTEEIYRRIAQHLQPMCRYFLNHRYGANKGELWYSKIKPRCIFEEFMEFGNTE